MSENIFGTWKRRFPILRNLRVSLEFAQRIILCTAILENMARRWREYDFGIPGVDEDEEGEQFVYVDEAENTRRMRGQIARENLLLNMP